jgi:hypothetical protein
MCHQLTSPAEQQISHYRFEFSETGNSRREGQLILLGDKVESVTLEPYQMLP